MQNYQLASHKNENQREMIWKDNGKKRWMNKMQAEGKKKSEEKNVLFEINLTYFRYKKFLNTGLKFWISSFKCTE